MEFLPVMHPRKAEDPTVFAERVRQVVAAAADCSVSDHYFKDLLLIKYIRKNFPHMVMDPEFEFFTMRKKHPWFTLQYAKQVYSSVERCFLAWRLLVALGCGGGV